MRITAVLLLFVAIVAVGCAPGEVAETPAPDTIPPPATDTAEPAPTEPPEPEEIATDEPTVEDVLAGTSWELVSFGPAGAETDVADESAVTLIFETGGQAGGNGGCNAYGGAYEVDGSAISFGEIVSTLMACADNTVMDQEASYLAALRGADSFEIDGDRLTIAYDGGESVLNFVREGEGSTAGEQGASLLLDELQMIDPRHGWALGQIGDDRVQQVLVTEDAGATWQTLAPEGAPAAPGEQRLEAAAYFASADQGWLSYALPAPVPADADPRVWVTRDGGARWERGTTLDLSGMPYDHFYPSHLGLLDDEFGWLLAHLGAGMSHDYVAIFTTADGGATWQRVADPDSSPDVQPCNKSGLLFTGERDGFLAGDCPGLMPRLFFYQTTDGGATWVPALLPVVEGQPVESAEELGNACGVRQMSLIGAGTVAISLHCFDFDSGSAQAWLYRSDDNGQNWQPQPLPVSDGHFDFISPTEGWVLGEANGEPGVLFATIDGGATWQQVAQIGAPGQVDFVDAETGWILTGGDMDEPRLFRLTAGGESWEEIMPAIAP